MLAEQHGRSSGCWARSCSALRRMLDGLVELAGLAQDVGQRRAGPRRRWGRASGPRGAWPWRRRSCPARRWNSARTARVRGRSSRRDTSRSSPRRSRRPRRTCSRPAQGVGDLAIDQRARGSASARAAGARAASRAVALVGRCAGVGDERQDVEGDRRARPAGSAESCLRPASSISSAIGVVGGDRLELRLDRLQAARAGHGLADDLEQLLGLLPLQERRGQGAGRPAGVGCEASSALYSASAFSTWPVSR